MIRRTATLVTAICMAILFYAIWVGLIVDRIERLIHVQLVPRPGTVPLPREVFGLPLALVIMLASILPVTFIAAEIALRMRRRERWRRDECLECGRPITSWRGRCPGCGMRIGPDPPRAHTLRY